MKRKSKELSPKDSADRMMRQLFLGFVKTHILYHASVEPVCGVELAAELEHHGYTLSPGTLYPTLHGLESAGYLRSAPQLHKGRRRKSYRLTAIGRRALAEAKKRLAELVEEVLQD